MLLTLFVALFGGYLLFQGYRYRRRRQFDAFLETAECDDTQRNALGKTLHYPALEPEERRRAERLMLRFYHTLEFRGVDTEVDGEMRTVISFYAALLCLHRGTQWLAHVHTVWLYRDGFLVDEQYERDGIVSSGTFELDGQSSPDAVVLSWADVAYETFTPTPDNVVIHEFAHAVDFADGEADGVPPMHRDQAEAWQRLLETVFDPFAARVDEGVPLEIYEGFGEYAAQNEAEFFAVASERFYQVPGWLHADFPELFAFLVDFYGTDPRRWGVEAPFMVES